MLLNSFIWNLNLKAQAREQILLLVFVSILIVSSYILYVETSLYVDTYLTLFSIKSAILEVSVNIQENEAGLFQGYIDLKLAVHNPSKIDVQIISLDFTHGIFLNNVKLNYYEPKIFSHLNIIVPKGETHIFNLNFKVTSQRDLKYLLRASILCRPA